MYCDTGNHIQSAKIDTRNDTCAEPYDLESSALRITQPETLWPEDNIMCTKNTNSIVQYIYIDVLDNTHQEFSHNHELVDKSKKKSYINIYIFIYIYKGTRWSHLLNISLNLYFLKEKSYLKFQTIFHRLGSENGIFLSFRVDAKV